MAVLIPRDVYPVTERCNCVRVDSLLMSNCSHWLGKNSHGLAENKVTGVAYTNEEALAG